MQGDDRMHCKKEQKNNALEFYRLLFTIVIIIHHSQYFVGKLSWLKNGYICVEFFFILSGYLLYKSFSKEENHSTLNYLRKRIQRLWPEYAVAALLAILANAIILKNFNLTKAINELLMVQNTGLFRLGGYNYPCWYIPVMFACGAFIYSILSLWKKQYIRFFAPLIILIGYTYINGLDRGLEAFGYTSFFSNMMVRGMCEMSIGVLIGVLVEKDLFTNTNPFACTIIEITSIAFVVIGITTDIVADMVTIVAFSVLVAITIVNKGYISSKVLSSGLWNVCGKYTYAAYLNHAMILYILSYVNGHLFAINHFIRIPLALALVFIYALLSNKLIWKFIGSLQRKHRIRVFGE